MYLSLICLSIVSLNSASTQISILFNNDFPISIGGQFRYSPIQVLDFTLSIGYTPPAYIDVVAAIVEEFDDTAADFIERSIENCIVPEIHIGIRPVVGLGLKAQIGYSLFLMAGGIHKGDILNEILPSAPSETINHRFPTIPESPKIEVIKREEEIPVNSLIHNLRFYIGYGWLLWTGVTIEVGLMFLMYLHSHNEVDISEGQLLQVGISEIVEEELEKEIEETYRNYLYFPSILIRMGYSF